IPVSRLFEGLDELRREPAIGAHLRVGHQLRQLVGGRPLPFGAAMPKLRQILLRRAVVGEQRAEANIYCSGHRDNSERYQEELNGESGHDDQRTPGWRLALDEFIHEWVRGDLGTRRKLRHLLLPSPGQVNPARTRPPEAPWRVCSVSEIATP